MQLIENTDTEAVAFNWAWDASNNRDGQLVVGERKDLEWVVLRKNELVKKYISLPMDGSVIYTAIKRNLIINNKIIFSPGYHEDVDFIFKVYWHSMKTTLLNEVLYYKRNRSRSIVNSLPTKHINGFFRAWGEIGEYIKNQSPGIWDEYLPHFKL